MNLPPERILYTDANGGQILGYTRGDLHRLAAELAHGRPASAPALDLTPWQGQVLQAVIDAGSAEGAARRLGVGRAAVRGALESVHHRYPGSTTLQLCAMYARTQP